MSAWFIAPRSRPAARLRLFAVPYAGRGASMFFRWHDSIPEWMELLAVQLPGREGRLAEGARRRLDEVIRELALAIRPRLDRAYALFGHSMGALVCFELARELRRLGMPAPAALVLSGRGAPTVRSGQSPLHVLSDSAFIESMQSRYDGIPQVVLEQPDLLSLLLPTLRHDIEAMETYEFRPGAPLQMPFLLYGGQSDRQASPESLGGWRTLTTGPTSQRLFPGGHFYVQDNRNAVIQALSEDLVRFT